MGNHRKAYEQIAFVAVWRIRPFRRRDGGFAHLRLGRCATGLATPPARACVDGSRRASAKALPLNLAFTSDIPPDFGRNLSRDAPSLLQRTNERVVRQFRRPTTAPRSWRECGRANGVLPVVPRPQPQGVSAMNRCAPVGLWTSIPLNQRLLDAAVAPRKWPRRSIQMGAFAVLRCCGCVVRLADGAQVGSTELKPLPRQT